MYAKLILNCKYCDYEITKNIEEDDFPGIDDYLNSIKRHELQCKKNPANSIYPIFSFCQAFILPVTPILVDDAKV